MRRLLGKFRRDERGQAVVEFALVSLLLLVLIIGVFEFGRALNLQQVITMAAREGARRAVVADNTVTQPDIEDVVKEAIAIAGFDSSAATITFPDGFKTGTGNVTSVRVEMPFEFKFLRPLIAFATDTEGVIQLATETRFRNE